MPHIRTIQPSFAKSPSMGRVSLPPLPNERMRDSRKILERSRSLRESTLNILEDNALYAILERLAEIAESKKPGVAAGGDGEHVHHGGLKRQRSLAALGMTPSFGLAHCTNSNKVVIPSAARDL